jgi:hypothetical protein
MTMSEPIQGVPTPPAGNGAAPAIDPKAIPADSPITAMPAPATKAEAAQDAADEKAWTKIDTDAAAKVKR